MSAFTEREIEYLHGQGLGRLATVGADGTPHVVPTSFRYDPDLDVLDIAGHNLAASKKFRDAKATGRAAFVVDDVLPGSAWQARGVEVRGRAEVLGEGGAGIGEGFSEERIRLIPERIVGWGLDTEPYKPNSRSVASGSGSAA